jgi:hypothetical protein
MAGKDDGRKAQDDARTARRMARLPERIKTVEKANAASKGNGKGK